MVIFVSFSQFARHQNLSGFDRESVCTVRYVECKKARYRVPVYYTGGTVLLIIECVRLALLLEQWKELRRRDESVFLLDPDLWYE